MANLKLRLRPTSQLKLRVAVNFPAAVTANSGLAVTLTNGTYTFSESFGSLVANTAPATDSSVKILNSITGQYQTATLSAIGGSLGAALTRTNDTNVIITLGGTPGTALLQATSLTVSWSGKLAETRGGTNQSTYILGDLLYASAANTLSKLAGNTTSARNFLRQTGTGTVSAAPAWDTILAADIPGSAFTRTSDTNVTLTLGGSPTTAVLNAMSVTVGWSGSLAASRGGTGVANASTITVGGAFVTSNAVSLPTIAQGDLWYGSASGVISALAKSASASQFLKNSGTSNNPAWAQPAASDLSNGTNGTGAVVLTSGPTISGLTVGGSFTATGLVTNAALANMAAYTLKGNFTGSAAAPTDSTIGALTQKVSPASTDLILISDEAASHQLKYATVSSIASAGSVSSIAGNTGAFTLSNGITNSINDIRLDPATQAEMEAATITNKAVTPGLVQNHPGVCKQWALFTSAGVTTVSYNTTSTSKDSTGIYSITIGTDMSSANYVVVCGDQSGGTFANTNTYLAGSYKVEIRNTTNTNVDAISSCAAFGDQ